LLQGQRVAAGPAPQIGYFSPAQSQGLLFQGRHVGQGAEKMRDGQLLGFRQVGVHQDHALLFTI
jgi:hypothetical protein